jgi:hypothetical protein
MSAVRRLLSPNLASAFHTRTLGSRLQPSTWGQLALWLLGVCLLIQIKLIDPSSPNLPRYFVLLLIAGALAAGALALALRGTLESVTEVRLTASHAAGWAWIGAGAGVVCGIIGALVVARDEWPAQWWWVAAMTIPIAVLAIDRAVSWRRDRGLQAAVRPAEIAIPVALLAIALAPRLPAITSTPPFLLGDEAQCGLYGRLFDAGHTPLLSISWFGLPMLSYAVSGVGLWVFGNDFAGFRLINACVGAGGVVLLYFLGKEWFGRRTGIIVGLLLSVWFLPLELSRDGIHYIQGPVCITLTLLLCTLWLNRGGALLALLSGMSFALDLQVYWSARVAPLLALLFMSLCFLRDRSLLRLRTRELAWMIAGGLAAGLPVLGLFNAVPGSFNGHQGDVSIFSSDPATQGHLVSQYGQSSKVSILLQQIWKVLTAFNARGDSSTIFGQWGKPILDNVSAALLPAAVALAILRARRPEYLVTLVWAAAVAGANAITIDPPLWNRLLALMPALALLIGVLLSEVWRMLSGQIDRRWIGSVLAMLLATIAGFNLHAAFVDYPDVARQESMNPTSVGEFLAHAPGAANTVLLSDGSFYVNYEPIRFLAPDSGGCTVLPGQPLSSCPIAARSRLFVLLPGRVGDLSALERERPGGRVIVVATPNYGADRILAYELT